MAIHGFLNLNGYVLTCSDDDLACWILLCSAELTIAELAERIRPYLT
jgi:prophage maintenance system killer protein